MRIWIIGKRGILASAMQRKCLEKSIDFIATSRREVDIEDSEGVKAQFETLSFTHVVNCSGYTAVDQAEEEKDKARRLNVEGVALLATLAKEMGKKLIHFSTDYVFDGKKERYSVNDPLSPISEYGKSKAEGEKQLHTLYPEACLIRTSWLFGREGNHFVRKMIELMEKEETLRVVSDQQGRPTYADDLAEAVISLLDNPGIFHFASAGETSWYGFAEVIKRKLEERNHPICCKRIEPITSEEFMAKAQRPRSSILETHTFSPPHWEKGLEEVIRYALQR